jgi:serine/threonine protein kinase
MDNFEVNQIPLGKGLFGVSDKAKRKSDNVDVCIKCSHKIHDNERMGYEKEILVLSAMKHENIINYISHFYYDDRVYIEMEFADGGDLYQIIKRDLTEQEILEIFIQIVQGIQCIHSH